MSDFEGLVAVVTGGASGIGAATVRLLRDRGARVAVLDRDGGPASACELTLRVDVTDDAAVRAAIAETTAALGRIDVLVNNAGIGAQGAVDANDDAEWLRVFDVNVLGVARVTRACLPHLRQSPAAAIVNTSSIVALRGLPQRALYSASKGALLSLTLAMAADLLDDGVRVNCVAPGTTLTPWIERLMSSADDPDAELRALEARQPIKRLVRAEEVATAICYLASPAAGAVTGTVLPVDGGATALIPRRG